MPDQIPKAVVQERYERLLAMQEEISWAENRKLEGRTVEVLVANGEGRKDAATARLSGRARDNRLVHFAVSEGVEAPRPGDVVEVAVTRAAPHHLVADSGVLGGVFTVRRTAGGGRMGGTAGHARFGSSRGHPRYAVHRTAAGPRRTRCKLSLIGQPPCSSQLPSSPALRRLLPS